MQNKLRRFLVVIYQGNQTLGRCRPALREELKHFLRHARARLQPEDAGVTRNSGRRVTGLRREEVAELAGVSNTWYTLFETGTRTVSPAFLQRVSGVLQLNPYEQRYLYALCCVPAELCDAVAPLDEAVETLINSSAAVALAVLDDSLHLLAHNELYSELRMLPGQGLRERLDLAWWVFTSSAARRLYVDWEEKAASVCGFLRMNAALELPNTAQSVARLLTVNEFERLWNRFDVIDPREAQLDIAYHHPRAGVILTRVNALGMRNGHRQLLIQSGADGESNERLRWLTESAA